VSRADLTASGRDGQLPVNADVVVVGAGITGASIAHHLARQGVSVVVIEQAPQPCAGATGRSGGLVRAYDPDPLIADLALRSLHVYRDPGCWKSGQAPLHEVGAVTVADPGQEPILREAAARISGALRLPAHVVIQHEQVEGIRLAGGIALVEPQAGWVAAAQVTADWLAQARSAGAVVCHGVRVLEVAERDGRPVALTDAGTVSAGAVVAAVGPWAADPIPGLRPASRVRSRSIQVSIVERPPSAPPHATFVDLRTGLYAKPVDSRRTLIGMPHLVWDCPIDAPPDPGHERATVSALTPHFPWLTTAAHLDTVRAADAYGSGEANGQAPGLLEGTGLPHVWSVRGWNGGGVKTAPEAGRRIADACVADAFSDAG
jgi:glycine/D-amino acid oxidase-like deaminating enzyme